MKNTEIKKLAEEILDHEQKIKCGINIAENEKKITEIMEKLPPEQLIKLMLELEKNI